MAQPTTSGMLVKGLYNQRRLLAALHEGARLCRKAPERGRLGISVHRPTRLPHTDKTRSLSVSRRRKCSISRRRVTRHPAKFSLQHRIYGRYSIEYAGRQHQPRDTLMHALSASRRWVALLGGAESGAVSPRSPPIISAFPSSHRPIRRDGGG